VSARIATVLAAALLAGPARGEAGFIHEYPRAPLVLQLHPRDDQPFTLTQIERALRAGAHAVELDLRWRADDGAVVCSHGPHDLAERPTLDAVIGAIIRFQGGAPTVRGDGMQFYLVLDLKEDSPALHGRLLDVLRRHASAWSNAARPGSGPRGITVVVSGAREAFERSAQAAGVDSLCLFEGRDYGTRILDLSDRNGTFQWVSLKHRVDHERIRALQAGRDRAIPGRFNVRVYGARGRAAGYIRAGADAVNLDSDELEAEWARPPRRPVQSAPDSRARGPIPAAAGHPIWISQEWNVGPQAGRAFEAAWRRRAEARHGAAPGWLGRLLLRGARDTVVYRGFERWRDRAALEGAAAVGGIPDTTGPGPRVAHEAPLSERVCMEIESRLGGPVRRGELVRVHRFLVRPGMERSFERAWRRANAAIRSAHPAARGAALLRDPSRPDLMVEIVHWTTREAWRRFASAVPPDPDADAAIREAIVNVEIEEYEGIDGMR
jgi:heme-degrading monooxygenase HmoA